MWANCQSILRTWASVWPRCVPVPSSVRLPRCLDLFQATKPLQQSVFEIWCLYVSLNMLLCQMLDSQILDITIPRCHGPFWCGKGMYEKEQAGQIFLKSCSVRMGCLPISLSFDLTTWGEWPLVTFRTFGSRSPAWHFLLLLLGFVASTPSSTEPATTQWRKENIGYSTIDPTDQMMTWRMMHVRPQFWGLAIWNARKTGIHTAATAWSRKIKGTRVRGTKRFLFSGEYSYHLGRASTLCLNVWIVVCLDGLIACFCHKLTFNQTGGHDHCTFCGLHTGSGVGASFWVSPKPSSPYVSFVAPA